jgi:hypothetical protein
MARCGDEGEMLAKSGKRVMAVNDISQYSSMNWVIGSSLKGKYPKRALVNI